MGSSLLDLAALALAKDPQRHFRADLEPAVRVYDAMTGESTLFHRADIVEAGWTVLEPVLEAWEGSRAGLATYAAGSWGPDGADALMAGDGRQWRRPEGAFR